jgi:hypothetical protein
VSVPAVWLRVPAWIVKLLVDTSRMPAVMVREPEAARRSLSVQVPVLLMVRVLNR